MNAARAERILAPRRPVLVGCGDEAFFERRAAWMCLFLAIGAAAASVMFAYKLYQDRAADCGDFAECYRYAAGVYTFAVMAIADVVGTTLTVAQISRRRHGAAAVTGYAFGSATAITTLAVIFAWFLKAHPPLRTIVVLPVATWIFAGTLAVLCNFRNALTYAISGCALWFFSWVALLTMFL